MRGALDRQRLQLLWRRSGAHLHLDFVENTRRFVTTDTCNIVLIFQEKGAFIRRICRFALESDPRSASKDDSLTLGPNAFGNTVIVRVAGSLFDANYLLKWMNIERKSTHFHQFLTRFAS
jgi:hypothetical protein